jgi:transcriptional regulator with XRE-family HTH domain
MNSKKPMRDRALDAVYASLNYERTKTLIEEVVEKYRDAGLSENQFCKMLNIARNSWTRFVTGEQQAVDISLFIKLAHFLEKPESEVIDLYRKSVPDQERKELDDTKRYSFIANRFDLKSLRKIKFFSGNVADFAALEERIKQFFLFDKIDDYREIEVKPLYSRTKRVASDRMLQFWNTMVRYELQNVDNPNAFDRDRFKTILALFRTATLDEELGLSKIIQSLFSCGVTVIVQSYVTKTSIRGATFIIKGKPYIVLTNVGKRYATLWQTLAHECYHILTRLDELTRVGYRINGGMDKELFDSDLEEASAYTFAQQLFVDDKNFPQLEQNIAFDAIVEQLALSWNVHPALLYNAYLNKHPDEHGRYGIYLTKSLITVQNLEVKEPWKAPTIQIPISEIRQKFMVESIQARQN